METNEGMDPWRSAQASATRRNKISFLSLLQGNLAKWRDLNLFGYGR
jgi:hypothetical protein